MRAGSPRVQLRIGRPLAEVAPREGPELVVLKVQSASCGTCKMGSEAVASWPYVAGPNYDQRQPDARSDCEKRAPAVLATRCNALTG